MDLLLEQTHRDTGELVLDLAVEPLPMETTLPIRDGVWFLDEMSKPARFTITVDPGTLNIDDRGAYVFDGVLHIATDNLRREDKVRTVSGEAEIKQRAILASYWQTGAIPELPTVGNDTAELLTQQRTFSQYNARVIDNIKNLAGTVAYRPRYVSENGVLSMTIEGA